MKTTAKRTIALGAAVLLCRVAGAQLGWVEASAKGSRSDYVCFKHPGSKEAIYYSRNYDRERVVEEYPPYVWVDGTFRGYISDNHDAFLAAVRASLGGGRIAELAGRGEYLEVGFDLDQDGNILGVNFALDTATWITTDELYTLEKSICKHLSFKPIRQARAKLMGGYGIVTNFGEIEAGEIPHIRRMEAQQNETKRLFGD